NIDIGRIEHLFLEDGTRSAGGTSIVFDVEVQVRRRCSAPQVTLCQEGAVADCLPVNAKGAGERDVHGNANCCLPGRLGLALADQVTGDSGDDTENGTGGNGAVSVHPSGSFPVLSAGMVACVEKK